MSNTIRELQREISSTMPASLSIGGWSFYFLGKAVLAIMGAIELNLILNLALIAVLMIPVQVRVLRLLTSAVVFILAVILLYQESYLPPFERLIAQWDFVSNFTLSYQFELVARFIELRIIAGGLVFTIIFWYARQIFNLTTISIVALWVASIWSAPAAVPFQVETQIAERQVGDRAATVPNSPDQWLAEFYDEQQRSRKVQIIPAPEQPLDIIVLNVCSLSWQDLEMSDLVEHPLIQSGSIRLTNFYSGSSYSGPSTLRLLRGHCGHEPHSELFSASNDCALGSIFSDEYWQQEILMNHQGDFDNFLDLLRDNGGMSSASFLNPSDAPQIMRGFDQMPVYSDAYLLEQWRNSRPPMRSSFTLYNTISLHDGNQLFGFRGNSMASYRARAEMLLEELQVFMDTVTLTGRPTIVVIAPEHGAGLQGDRFQIPGMREIPTPTLTHVPVTFHFMNIKSTDSISIDHVTGPSAIAEILTGAVEAISESPERILNLERLGESVEAKPRIGENEEAIMLEFNQEMLIRTRTGGWMKLAR